MSWRLRPPWTSATMTTFQLVTTIIHIFIFCNVFLLDISSGSANDYVDQYLSTPDICPPVSALHFSTALTKEKIRLANFPNHTVIVRLTRRQGTQSASHFLNFRCKFQVTAPKGLAVMAVVRSLSLRTHGEDNCLDYVQFKREGTYKTQEICGSVTADDKSRVPEHLVGPRYFNDYAGAMDVTFSTGGSVADSRARMHLSIELVFTAYSECRRSHSKAVTVGHCADDACIPKGLFCDGVVNCAFGEEYGEDEKDCPEVIAGPSRAFSIFIFGITAVVTLIIVVALSCCCLYRLDKWRPCPRRNSNSSHQSSSRDRDVEFSLNRGESAPSLGHFALSAAPIGSHPDVEWRSITPNAPKLEDLPPSYTDLFPTAKT